MHPVACALCDSQSARRGVPCHHPVRPILSTRSLASPTVLPSCGVQHSVFPRLALARLSLSHPLQAAQQRSAPHLVVLLFHSTELLPSLSSAYLDAFATLSFVSSRLQTPAHDSGASGVDFTRAPEMGSEFSALVNLCTEASKRRKLGLQKVHVSMVPYAALRASAHIVHLVFAMLTFRSGCPSTSRTTSAYRTLERWRDASLQLSVRSLPATFLHT